MILAAGMATVCKEPGYETLGGIGFWPAVETSLVASSAKGVVTPSSISKLSGSAALLKSKSS